MGSARVPWELPDDPHPAGRADGTAQIRDAEWVSVQDGFEMAGSEEASGRVSADDVSETLADVVSPADTVRFEEGGISDMADGPKAIDLNDIQWFDSEDEPVIREPEGTGWTDAAEGFEEDYSQSTEWVEADGTMESAGSQDARWFDEEEAERAPILREDPAEELRKISRRINRMRDEEDAAHGLGRSAMRGEASAESVRPRNAASNAPGPAEEDDAGTAAHVSNALSHGEPGAAQVRDAKTVLIPADKTPLELARKKSAKGASGAAGQKTAPHRDASDEETASREDAASQKEPAFQTEESSHEHRPGAEKAAARRKSAVPEKEQPSRAPVSPERDVDSEPGKERQGRPQNGGRRKKAASGGAPEKSMSAPQTVSRSSASGHGGKKAARPPREYEERQALRAGHAPAASFEHSSERSQLIERLRRQASGLEEIRSLQGYSLITDDVRRQLTILLDETRTILRKLRDNEFEIAVVGLEKAGKSSFCNALMEYPLLPTRQARCTYTPTNIVYSEEGRGEVRFQTREEFEKDLRDKLKRLGIRNSHTYSMTNLTADTYEKVYEDEVSPENKKWYGSTLNQEIRDIIKYRESLSECLDSPPRVFVGSQLNSPEFKQYIERPEKAMAVKEVRIESPILETMKNAIIYDVPGFNSPTQMHREQTKRRMDSADAIIMIAAADAPSIVDEALKTFKGSDGDGTILSEKLFVFANRADRADLFENIAGTYREWGDTHRILRRTDRIFFGSANAYLQSLHELDPDDDTDYVDGIQKKLNRLAETDAYEEERIEASEESGFGILAIRQALEQYNETERFDVLRERAGRLQRRILAVIEELKSRVPDIDEEDTVQDIASDSMRFYDGFRHRAKVALNDYGDSLKNSVLNEKPLSNMLLQYIEKQVQPEVYEEFILSALDRAKKDLAIIADNATGNINLPEVESRIRSRTFDQMYLGDFVDQTAAIVSAKHADCVNEILDLALEAMEITEDSKYYSRVRELLLEEFAPFLDPGASANHYQSLIDRFSRDIFELLIGQTYSYHRYDRFAPDMDTFFSMAVYYDPDAAPTEKADIHKITNSMLRQSIFCYEMLCHQYAYDKFAWAVNEAENSVRECLNVTAVPTDLQKLLRDVFRKDPVNAGPAVAEIVEAAQATFASEAERTADIESGLKTMLSAGYKSLLDVDITNREEFIAVYQSCFSTDRVYEDVVSDLNDDIVILREVLEHCFIRALDPEKPFLTKEYNSIRKLLRHIDTGQFMDFISRNISLIRGSEFDRIEVRRREQEKNRICRRVISEILRDIRRAV